MVGGTYTHSDDMLASQYQSIDWIKHTTCKLTGSVTVGGTFWFLVPCMRKLHTRPALTWTADSTFIRSHQQALGNHPNE